MKKRTKLWLIDTTITSCIFVIGFCLGFLYCNSIWVEWYIKLLLSLV